MPRRPRYVPLATSLGAPLRFARWPTPHFDDFEPRPAPSSTPTQRKKEAERHVRLGRGLRQGGDVRRAQQHRRTRRPAARLRMAAEEVRRRFRLDHRPGRVRRARTAGRSREGLEQRLEAQYQVPKPGGVHDRARHGGADDPGPRHRVGQARLSDEDVPRRHRRLPAVQRARRRQRPGVVADQGRA